MTTLASALRRQLENAVRKARSIADAAAADAIGRLGIAAAEAPAYLSETQKASRRRLRAHARSLGDRREPDGAMATRHLAAAAAYEHWHRMLFGRFLVERNILIHPKHGVPISRGELKDLAGEEGLADEWALVERLAAPSLPGVFKPDDPVLALELDPHFQVGLRTLVTNLPEEVFAADDSLGWTYQFWQADEKKRVNDAQVKIGADELRAVTQLFTEPYMVKFLLHNTLGAWWAGKVLARQPDLAREAPDESTLREACALPGVDWEYLRFVREENGNSSWQPAAGTFPGWPQRAAGITYLDPCCGSGHFLVEAFVILAALRQEEEGVQPADAARAVLRDNLHGLEIDGRCVQIAAFSVALAAWRLAGGQITLPVPHIAWVGAPPPLPKAEFIALANGDAELQRGLATLHDLFRQAPLLGSLIELTGGDLVDATRIAQLDQSIEALVGKMRGAEPERAEGALAARGMADATGILARRFTLQATNPPFLGRSRQAPALADHLRARFDIARADLATAMMTRMRALTTRAGTVASVTPQNWLFLDSYKKMREALLVQASLAVIGALGPRCFETISGEVVNAALVGLTETHPGAETVFTGLDANDAADPAGKAVLLREGGLTMLNQGRQRSRPGSVISPHAPSDYPTLGLYAQCLQGLTTGDDARLKRQWWEVDTASERWLFLQGPSQNGQMFGGREDAVAAEFVQSGGVGGALRGREAWGKRGVAINRTSSLNASIYCGDLFHSLVPVVIANKEADAAAIVAFLFSERFATIAKTVNRSLSIDNGYFSTFPFDFAHWQQVAAEKYPKGLPEPYSDDPTQWLFHGHPRYAEAGTEVHVALARLAGYRWPAESDSEMGLSAEAHARIAETATLPQADTAGLLALVPILSERPLADRLRAYCVAAWGSAWTANREAVLIAAACEHAKDRPPKQLTFEAWLRGHAARQHARLFHDRPFLWWITDGRPDGFTVVAHYHRLDRGNLERLAYTLLNDWIDRLGDDPRAEAARILQQKLALILEGDAPYDIFVRWKSLESQPFGWNPDLDDGVRQNIRPFIMAGVLGCPLDKILKEVDRGKDVSSAPWYHLSQGVRRNDHHTTLAEKRGARRTKAAE